MYEARHEGERGANKLREVMLRELQTGDIQVEYAELRDPQAWSSAAPTIPMVRAQALIAALVGQVRLIDNLRLDAEEDSDLQYVP